MNKDISDNKEHFENTDGDNAKMMLLIFVIVVVLAIIIYYAYEWYKARKQNIVSNIGIVETTKPGIFSQFFTPKTTDSIPSYTGTSITGGKRKLKKIKISSNDDNNWTTIIVIGGISILFYILYKLYIELQMLRELEQKKIENTVNNEMTDNRDTIKIAIPKLVGSINAGQYITTRYGYFVDNP
jgi:hypothetical protein